jgi:TonB-linked SusC/RagA family outer membrane protein
MRLYFLPILYLTIMKVEAENVSFVQDTVRIENGSKVIDAGYVRINASEISNATAVSTIETFNRGMIHKAAQLIQGRLPGVSIVRPGGDPNGEFIFRIRGIATGQASAKPLFVIDGFTGIDPASIDPHDVATIVVLKDAAATSLYGVRGAQGVVIIQTKTGQKNQSRIEYAGSVAFDAIFKKPPVMNANEYRNLQGATDLGSSQDWIDLVTRKATTTVHHISMQGGSGRTQYRASVNYRRADGILNRSGFVQNNFRFNLSHQALQNRLVFESRLASTDRTMQNGLVEAFRYALTANPTMPVYSNLSDYGAYFQQERFDYFNPVALQNQNRSESVFQNRIVQQKITFDAGDWINGLSVSASYSRAIQSENTVEYFSKKSYFRGQIRNGLANITSRHFENDLTEAMVNYSRSFNHVRMHIISGYSYQQEVSESLGAMGGNFLTDAFGYHNLGASLDFNNGMGTVFTDKEAYKVISFFNRAQLNFSDKYILAASATRSGSTRLGANNKWGWFPSFSAAAQLHEIRNWKSFDQFNVRISWGKAGNLPAASYLSQARYSPTYTMYYHAGAYKPIYLQVSNENPDLKWEEKSERTLGVDVKLKNVPLNLAIDVFKNTIDDLILPVSLPSPPNPVGGGLLNVGTIQNKGVEISLSHEAVTGENFSWTWGVNYANIKSEMKSMSKGEIEYGKEGVLYTGTLDGPGCSCVRPVRVKEGQPLGQLFGPVFTSPDENGYPQFKDINGDRSFCYCEEDFTSLGQALPKFSYAISNVIKFRNWSLGIFLRGAAGHRLVNLYRHNYEPFNTSSYGYNVYKSRHYTSSVRVGSFSSHYVENAGYLKLDNAYVQYQVPLGVRSAITSLQLYFTAQNLFILTRYTGLDPEIRYEPASISAGGSYPNVYGYPFAMGLEGLNNYPLNRTITIGLSISF